MRVSEADTRMSGARLNGSRPFEKEKRGLHPIEFLPLKKDLKMERRVTHENRTNEGQKEDGY